MLVEIAFDLGVSDQAVSERLRRAQTEIIGRGRRRQSRVGRSLRFRSFPRSFSRPSVFGDSRSSAGGRGGFTARRGS
jgi:hypothetical protein